MILDKYNMTKEQNIFLAKRNIVDSIYSNARIEGINITFPETQNLYSGINVARLTVAEIDTIRNLKRAWEYVIKNIDDEMNLDFICKINEEVARDESLDWGNLRNGKVSISGTDYVPPIPEKDKVISDLKEILKIDCVTERAIKYMLYGMRNQLFWDGNKRTSIICANKIMIENGKGIITVKDKYLEEFSKLLSEFYTTGNSKKVEEFLVEYCIIGIDFE